MNALFHSTKSSEPAHRESAFRVFAALPTLVDNEHADVLKHVFMTGLQDHAPPVQIPIDAFDAFRSGFQRSKPFVNIMS